MSRSALLASWLISTVNHAMHSGSGTCSHAFGSSTPTAVTASAFTGHTNAYYLPGNAYGYKFEADPPFENGFYQPGAVYTITLKKSLLAVSTEGIRGFLAYAIRDLDVVNDATSLATRVGTVEGLTGSGNTCVQGSTCQTGASAPLACAGQSSLATATHADSGSKSYESFRFKWTAPPAGTGSITFYGIAYHHDFPSSAKFFLNPEPLALREYFGTFGGDNPASAKDCCQAHETTGCQVPQIESCAAEGAPVWCTQSGLYFDEESGQDRGGWDVGCISYAEDYCNLNCSFVAQPMYCSSDLEFQCPNCPTVYEPVCYLGLNTYCNECMAVCELVASTGYMSADEAYSRLTPGACNGICVRDDPCESVTTADLWPGIANPSPTTCIQVEGVVNHQYVVEGDPREYFCTPMNITADDVVCPECNRFLEPICVFSRYENPLNYINQCWAKYCFGLDDSMVTPGRCPHICDTDQHTCGPSRKCIPLKDNNQLVWQDEYRCENPTCLCAPGPVVCAGIIDGTEVDVANACVAECLGYDLSLLREGTCDGRRGLSYITGSLINPPPDDVFPGASDGRSSSDPSGYPVDLDLPQCDHCEGSFWEPVCAVGITFGSECLALCLGHRAKDLTPGECVSPCTTNSCDKQTQYCEVVIPGKASCINTPDNCICSSQFNPWCFDDGSSSLELYNDCTTDCAGLKAFSTPGACKEFKWNPWEKLVGPSEAECQANGLKNGDCLSCIESNCVWQNGCHRACDRLDDHSCHETTCPALETDCCQAVSEKGVVPGPGCNNPKLAQYVCYDNKQAVADMKAAGITGVLSGFYLPYCCTTSWKTETCARWPGLKKYASFLGVDCGASNFWEADRAQAILSDLSDGVYFQPKGSSRRDCCQAAASGDIFPTGCSVGVVQTQVCKLDESCCTTKWTSDCVALVADTLLGSCKDNQFQWQPAPWISERAGATCDTYAEGQPNHGNCLVDKNAPSSPFPYISGIDVSYEPVVACKGCRDECNCQDPNVYQGAYGGCSIYGPGTENFGYCQSDVDSYGTTACDACAECETECQPDIWASYWGGCETYDKNHFSQNHYFCRLDTNATLNGPADDGKLLMSACNACPTQCQEDCYPEWSGPTGKCSDYGGADSFNDIEAHPEYCLDKAGDTNRHFFKVSASTGLIVDSSRHSACQGCPDSCGSADHVLSCFESAYGNCLAYDKNYQGPIENAFGFGFDSEAQESVYQYCNHCSDRGINKGWYDFSGYLPCQACPQCAGHPDFDNCGNCLNDDGTRSNAFLNPPPVLGVQGPSYIDKIYTHSP